jgi:hypothetical protein|tara:strand:- start:240 stop:407 length:168 start_codon:yes stop_codon:yes gene_type:complete
MLPKEDKSPSEMLLNDEPLIKSIESMQNYTIFGEGKSRFRSQIKMVQVKEGRIWI